MTSHFQAAFIVALSLGILGIAIIVLGDMPAPGIITYKKAIEQGDVGANATRLGEAFAKSNYGLDEYSRSYSITHKQN